MYISKAKIDGFGKLVNWSRSFNLGFNVVYGPNESGKTTFHVFIEAMLYGLLSKNKKLNEAYRNYIPWWGEKFGGTLCLVKDNDEYCITRFYKGKGSKQEIFELSLNGKKIDPQRFDEELKPFLPPSRESFRAVYWINLDVVNRISLDSDVYFSFLKESFVGEGIKNPWEVIDQVDKKLVLLRGTSGEKGIIPLIEDAIKDTEASLKKALEFKKEVKEKSDALIEKRKELSLLKERLLEVEKLLSRYGVYKAVKSYAQKISDNFKKVTDILKRHNLTYKKLKEHLSNLNRYKVNLDRLKSMISERDRLAEDLKLKQKEAEEISKQIKKLKEKLNSFGEVLYKQDLLNEMINALSKLEMQRISIEGKIEGIKGQLFLIKEKIDVLREKLPSFDFESFDFKRLSLLKKLDSLLELKEEIENRLSNLKEKEKSIKRELQDTDALLYSVSGNLYPYLIGAVGVGGGIFGWYKNLMWAVGAGALLFIVAIAYHFKVSSKKKELSQKLKDISIELEMIQKEVKDTEEKLNGLNGQIKELLDSLGFEDVPEDLKGLISHQEEMSYYYPDYQRILELESHLNTLAEEKKNYESELKTIEAQIKEHINNISELVGKELDKVSEATRAAREILQEINNIEREIQSLMATERSLKPGLNSLDSMLKTTEKDIKAVLSELGFDSFRKFQEFYDMLLEINSLLSEISMYKSNMVSLSISPYERKYVFSFVKGLLPEYTEIEKERSMLIKEISAKEKEAEDLQSVISNLLPKAETEPIEEQLKELKNELLKYKKEHDLLVTSRSLVFEGIRRFETQRQPKVLEIASEYFREITNGRYNKLKLNLFSRDFELEIVDEKGNKLHVWDLSRGAKEQLYLCLRLAFADVMLPTGFPVIIDDAFVNFDYDRLSKTMEVISTRDNQTIFLTCHPQSLEIAKEKGANVVYMEG